MLSIKEAELDLIISNGIDHLDNLLAEACETEKMMPSVRVKQKLTHWMDYKTEWTAYGYGKGKSRLPKPTPKQIDRYDLVLELLAEHCTLEERQLIWAVNHSGAFRDRGPQWSKIGKILHINYRTVKRRYMDALYKLWYTLKPNTQNIDHKVLPMPSNSLNNK